MTLRQRVRKTIEALANGYIRRVGDRSFAFIEKSLPFEGWFSQDLMLRRLFQARQVDLVLDVGANVGAFGQEVRRFFHGDIVSFEPAPIPFAALSRAAEGDRRWKVVQTALGGERSTDILHVSDKTVFTSFAKLNEYGSDRFGAHEQHAVSVEVHRLDEIIEQLVPDAHSRNIFLKVDTQGHDLEVFRGAAGILHRIVGLQAEVSLIPIYHDTPHWTKAMEIYEKRFGVLGMFPVTRDDDGRVIEYDCLMMAAETRDRSTSKEYVERGTEEGVRP